MEVEEAGAAVVGGDGEVTELLIEQWVGGVTDGVIETIHNVHGVASADTKKFEKNLQTGILWSWHGTSEYKKKRGKLQDSCRAWTAVHCGAAEGEKKSEQKRKKEKKKKIMFKHI